MTTNSTAAKSTNEDTANIDAIAKVLLSHGEMFHGGRAKEIAREWDGYDFTAAGVDRWCRVGVWDAATAEAFVEAGMTPSRVNRTAERMVEADGADAYTSGCPIYAVSNGDLSPRAIIKAWRRYQQD
jgi:hypothetical protein